MSTKPPTGTLDRDRTGAARCGFRPRGRMSVRPVDVTGNHSRRR